MANMELTNVVTEMAKLNRRSLWSGIGLVGLGTVIVGAGALYISYQIKKEFRDQETIIEKLRNDIQGLRIEILELKDSVRLSANQGRVPGKANSLTLRSPRSILGDDDEYLTADEDDDDDDESSTGSLLLNGTLPSGERYDGRLNLYFAKIDALLDGSVDEQRRGYKILKDNEQLPMFHNSCDFWWRLAKGAHFEASAVRAGEGHKKAVVQELITQGHSYAEKAVELDDNSASAHKWLAILCGSKSEFLGINDRIKGGYKFKEHVDRAISLDPTDSTCHYLLGRFCLEVSMLSWIERQVAMTLFSTPPSSTPQEAMIHFQKCESLKPFMDNRFYMAKSYYAQQNKIEALKWLDLAASMPANTATDKVCLENVITFRKKLQLE